MGCSCGQNVSIPQRDLGRETEESLRAQREAVPQQYQLDAIYQPHYQLLALQNLERNLLGFGGGNVPTDATGRFTGGIQEFPYYGNQQPPAGTSDPLRTETIRQGAPGAVRPPVTPPSQPATFTPPDAGGPTALTGTTLPADRDVSHTADLTVFPEGSDPAAGIPAGTRVYADNITGYNSYTPHYRYVNNSAGTGWQLFERDPQRGNLIPSGGLVGALPSGYTYESGSPGGGTGGGTGGGSQVGYVPPQRGILDIFGQDVIPELTRWETEGNTARRAADIADVERLGPQFREAFNAANPEQTALMSQLNQLAGEGLNAGLTPYEERAAQQAARGAQSARGFGYGQNDAFDEAMKLALDTQQRREANRQFGLQVAGANNAFSVDPLLALTGRSSQGAAAGAAAAAGGFYRPPAGTMFDPFNAYASDLFSSNQNAAAAEDITKANNIAAIGASL